MLQGWEYLAWLILVCPLLLVSLHFAQLHAPFEFGAFAGERKWEGVLQIPDQRIRDALLNYLIVQGDTEFASCEQQRWLFRKEPDEAGKLIRIGETKPDPALPAAEVAAATILAQTILSLDATVWKR